MNKIGLAIKALNDCTQGNWRSCCCVSDGEINFSSHAHVLFNGPKADAVICGFCENDPNDSVSGPPYDSRLGILTHRERQANAVLIQAAPDMAQLLKSSIPLLEELQAYLEYDNLTGPREAVTDLLSKIEGRDTKANALYPDPEEGDGGR